MNTLGLRITSSVLATALCLAPINSALAAPEGEVAPAEGDAPADAEAPAEGEAPADAEAPAEGEPPAEGEAPAEGEPPAEGEVAAEGAEGEPAEGEVPAEGEGTEVETPAEGEGEPAEGEGEGEGEGEVEAEGEGEGEEAVEDDLDLDGPMRPPEPAWGPKKQYPMNGKGALIGGGVIAGLGVASIVTSLLITSCNFDSALSCKFNDQRDFLVPISVTATGLGLMLIGVGIGNRIKYKKWENWTPEQETAVVPTMVPGGGGLAWVGRF